MLVLEARNRIGGRIYTEIDPVLGVPIEMGAEFIHGRPKEILEPLQKHKIKVTEVDGDEWCERDGKLGRCNFLNAVDHILDRMTDRRKDESFCEFLEREFPDSNQTSDQREEKQRAIGYVSGFNAADPKLVGVHWLVKGMKADEKIEGERSFRARGGYRELVELFLRAAIHGGAVFRTGSVVRSIAWEKGKVGVRIAGRDGIEQAEASSALITLPLGVLMARSTEVGAVRFRPQLPESKRAAMQSLEMGKVIRVTLRFRTRFWEKLSPPDGRPRTLANMSFLFSDDDYFPTWWTTMPEKLPIITGWAPFRAGEKLSGRPRSFVVDRSLRSLSKVLGISRDNLGGLLEAAYFHDWQKDPFSRGAYSYGKVGADAAQKVLGQPLARTLFFAGEATDITGHNGTVHGAIASGYRAAKELLRSIQAEKGK